jgi:N-acetylmuramoyl-L-alanine amidase
MAPGSPVNAGTAVTLTASATGGTAPLQYEFWRYSYTFGAWTVARAWSTSNQMTWTPGALEGGWYKMQVWARSAGGTDVEAFADNYLLVQTPAPKILSLRAASGSTGSSGMAPDSPITISAIATGGQTGVVEYEFWRYNTGTLRWSLDRPWSTNNSYQWMPAISDEGVHYVQVWVRDTAHTDWQDWTSTELVVSRISVVSMNPLTATVADGDPLPFVVVAAGNDAGYEFKFWRYNVPTGRWQVIRDYGTNNTFNWVPTSLDWGANVIQVWVRAAGSNASYAAWISTNTITVTPPGGQ